MITISQPKTNKDLEGVADVTFRVDGEAMSRFWTDQYADTFRLQGRENARAAAFSFPEHTLAAKEGEKVVGMIVFSEAYANFEGEALIPDSAIVNNVYVLPEYRGRGIGRQLLDAAQERLQNYSTIVLYVYEDNLDAKDFYQHYGFRFDGVSFFDGEVYRGSFQRMILDNSAGRLARVRER